MTSVSFHLLSSIFCPATFQLYLQHCDFQPLLINYYILIPKPNLPYRYFTKYHFIFSYHRNNMPERVCVYNFSDSATWMCNIFKLGDIISDNPGWLLRCLLRPGDMVTAAGGDYTKLSVGGGVVAIHIQWICNLDWDFLKYCLPKWVFTPEYRPTQHNWQYIPWIVHKWLTLLSTLFSAWQKCCGFIFLCKLWSLKTRIFWRPESNGVCEIWKSTKTTKIVLYPGWQIIKL